MTELLHKEFSRKSFLKGGGALVVGFSVAGATSGAASAAFPTPSPDGYLPDLATVDAWLRVNADNTVTVTSAQGEYGQGTPTGILILVAEELDMRMDQMRFQRPDTWVNATGGGSGSGGISSRATPVRAAAVAARDALLGMAATRLGVPKASLTVREGVVSGGGRSVSYGELIGDRLFNVRMAAGATQLAAGQAPAKPIASYKLVGSSPPRIDIPAKVAGNYVYVHSIKLPGMVHARVVRPRGQGAVASVNNQPLSIDRSSIKQIPGARVVQVNNFVAVVAEKEYDAIQGAAQLKVTWKSDARLPGIGNFWKDLRDKDSRGELVQRYTTNTGNVNAALSGARHVVSATYKYPYQGHHPIGPQCACADVRSNVATIFSNLQSIAGIPTAIAPHVGLQPKQVRAFFYEGSSSYGSGQTLDVAIAAAVVSKAVGKPVRMQWMRWDAHGWDPFGPAAMYDVSGGVDANGKIVAMDWATFGQAGANVQTSNELLGTEQWPATPALGGPGTSDTIYTIPNKRVLAKSQPLYNGAFKSSPLRAPGRQQSHFAGEQIVDELAYAARMDPIEFRRLNIDGRTVAGEKWLSVLDAATKAAKWEPRVAFSRVQTGNIVTGRGFSFGIHGSQEGMVVDIEVNKRTGKILVKHMWAAQNNGVTVYGDGVRNQMEGAAIMGLSRALHEQVMFDKERVTNVDWVAYPILRFVDAPKVTVINVEAKHLPATGSGEGADVPPSAAIANAFFDATGVRIREVPLTPARVRATLAAAKAGTYK